MKIYELEITANAPSEQYAYVPADSDVGFSLNIKGKENLVPTGVFDEKGDIREPDGYLDEAQTVPFYKVHTLPENSAEKFQVEYTAENSEGEQVAMEFYVNVISTKSGFSYVAAGGGSGSDVTKAYVDAGLSRKQDKLTEANAGENVTITDENGIKTINAVDTKPDVNKAYVDENLALKQDKLTEANAGWGLDISSDADVVKINNYGSSFYKGAPAELVTKTRVGEELTGTFKIKIDPRYTYYSTKFGVDGREIANCVWNFEIDESLFPQAEKFRDVVPVIWVNLGGAPVPSQYFKSGQQIKFPPNYIWVGEPMETLTVERGKCYMFALTKVDGYWVINKQFEYQINVQ